MFLTRNVLLIRISYVMGNFVMQCGKVVPVVLTEHHTIKAYWGSGDIVPRILGLGI
jgi:hypothetical protein